MPDATDVLLRGPLIGAQLSGVLLVPTSGGYLRGPRGEHDEVRSQLCIRSYCGGQVIPETLTGREEALR